MILGIDFTSILLLLVIAAVCLGGLFLLWGGSIKELEDHPLTAMQQTGGQIIHDPNAAYAKTQEALKKNNAQYGSFGGWAQHEYNGATGAAGQPQQAGASA